MDEVEIVGRKAQSFFDGLWCEGDYWKLETSDYEQAKYARQLAPFLGDRKYDRVLEIGCGAGYFTGLLAPRVGSIVAIDVAPSAIERARRSARSGGAIDFRVANVMDLDLGADGPWDLVIFSETIYYLGWLYPFFSLGWLAIQLHEATRDGGRLMMCNTIGGVDDYLLLPPLIRTYRDLLLNVGYQIESEETFRGVKDGISLEALITLFSKSPQARGDNATLPEAE